MIFNRVNTSELGNAHDFGTSLTNGDIQKLVEQRTRAALENSDSEHEELVPDFLNKSLVTITEIVNQNLLNKSYFIGIVKGKPSGLDSSPATDNYLIRKNSTQKHQAFQNLHHKK